MTNGSGKRYQGYQTRTLLIIFAAFCFVLGSEQLPAGLLPPTHSVHAQRQGIDGQLETAIEFLALDPRNDAPHRIPDGPETNLTTATTMRCRFCLGRCHLRDR